MPYGVSQNMVEICIRGQIRLLDINEALPVKCKKSDVKEFPRLPIPSSLPKPQFQVKQSYNKTLAPKRAASYFRYIEKSLEELDQEIEYDMDEEDYAWLDIMNERRQEQSHSKVPCEIFEQLMDRFEKESYFESQTSGSVYDPLIDEDAVCCICNDGECSNSNVILFCDMCNLAVHQDCYGVPFIPEGQWLCRRCLNSPSKPVDCVLCPSKAGAFKQTECNRWVHVLCALWVPEVHFSNPVFLEPIDSINEIPAARWKLTCYICRRREGACIQCVRTNCYTAFHVTCAQQAGLHMKIETYQDESGNSTVKNVAFCDIHTPADSDVTPLISRVNDESDAEEGKKVKRKSILLDKKLQQKLKKKFSCETGANAPIVNIPYINEDKMDEILNLVDIDDKGEFFERLKAYWTLKRQARNGVPLLRRLQVSHTRTHTMADEESVDKDQLVKCQRLRHDLERARLLVELIRKREKRKKEQLKVAQHLMEMELCPLSYILNRTVDLLFARDTEELFHEPVNVDEVQGYLDEIKQPMDLGTIRSKVENMEYSSFDQFKADFMLIISNCLLFNATGSNIYKYAEKLKDTCRTIMNRCKQTIENTPIDWNTLLLLKQEEKTLEEQLVDVKNKVEEAKAITNWSTRTSRLKQLRREIRKIKQRMNEEERLSTADSMSSAENPKSEPEEGGPSGEDATKDKQSKISEFFVKKEDGLEGEGGSQPSTPAAAPTDPAGGSASGNTTARRNRNHLHIEIEKEISEMLQTNQESLGKKILRFLKRHNISERKMGSDICMDGGQLSAFLNNKCSLTNTNRELIYSWFVQQRRNREPERLTEEYDSSNSPSDTDSQSSQDTDLDETKEETDPEREDPELSKDNASKTPVSSSVRTSSRTPKPRQLDLPDDSPQLARKRKRTATPDTGSRSTTSSACDDTFSDEGVSCNLKQMDLVWAKCAGYPAYPALIVDPSTVPGFTHCGIPIPVPPPEVLKQRSSKPNTFLVLFFDTRRTWQWLPHREATAVGCGSGNRCRQSSRM
ncbi:bromodomain-containing protein 1-like isoform X2 [Bolinopsis microptera]|uniref:bromodomain-containing protein 1-like isoform X2 n=1 Tax=Bolinopsis microptera TaxID=2820187 RepID=UPI00307A8E1F